MKLKYHYAPSLIVLLFGLPVSLKAEIIYVDAEATSGGNGSTWASSYNDLQSALAEAVTADEIRVANGIYYPDEGTGQVDNDRSSTFQLKSGVTVLGGFPTGGGELSERDPSANVTTLSGDIDQNDDLNFSNDSGNAYHVVNGTGVDETATIDGFVVTAGRADGPGSDRRGGGMYCDDNSSPTVSNCSFISNFGEIGGGFYTCGRSSPNITNCSFIGNLSAFGGGMYNCINSAPVLTNCLLHGNKSSSNGGAIYNDLNSSSTYINCTFTGNKTDRVGGAVYNTRTCSPQFINCIVWNNNENGSTTTTGASVANDIDCFPTYSHSLVANSGGSANWDATLGTDNGNNIDSDPLFILDANSHSVPSTEGDLRLGEGSPAINAGINPDEPAESDIEGNPRIQNLTIDLGAYEGSFGPIVSRILYVDASATGQADGLGWADAFPNLQDALQIAASGDTLHVAEGAYYPDEGAGQTDNDRLTTFQLKTQTTLLGGFPAGGGDLSERNPAAHLTILSGDIDQNDVAGFTNISGNSFTVVNGSGVDSTAILDGFTITAGNADGTTRIETRGGGMFCNDNSFPSISNCTFKSNWGVVGGGFYSCNNSFPNLVNCLFVGNLSDYGGGMFNCIGSAPMLTNCAFTGNRSFRQGGAIYNDLDASPTFTNCSFSGNQAERAGGAIYNTRSSSPEFVNCIIWNNAEAGSLITTGASIANDSDSTPVFSYSLIAHSGGSANWDAALGTDNGNNIDSNPLFVLKPDPLTAPGILGSLRLREGSPALNTGDDTANQINNDLARSARILDSTIDMGAYEGSFSARFATFYPGLDPAEDNNGNGLPNFVDYAQGFDPLSAHDFDAGTQLAYSASTLLLILTRRVDVEDVFVTWQRSNPLQPDSWVELEEGTDFLTVSTSLNGIRQTSMLELPASPAANVFYRQIFSEAP